MFELFSEERLILTRLHIPLEEVNIWSCIEGYMGRAWVNDKSEPSYGIVAVADFLYLLGIVPGELKDDLMNLIEGYGRNQIIVCHNKAWEQVIKEKFPNNHVAFMRYALHWDNEAFDQERLKGYVKSGDSLYTVVPFTLEIAESALRDSFTADFCMFFESPQAFLEHGIGCCILERDQIIAGASSYSICSRAIDITIGTLTEHRRKGLALKCAAQLILDCLERGLYPRWDAVNLESVALAEKLGYRFKEAYQVYTIK